MMTDISIVILNYKMRARVEACLHSLFLDIENSQLSISVLVSDNNSDDGLLEWIKEKYPHVIAIQNGANIGFGAGVNAALKQCSARYYFVLNPDTQCIEPQTIQRLYEWMEAHERVGMCAPKLLNGDGSIQFSCNEFPTPSIQLLRRSPLSNIPWIRRKIDQFLMKKMDRTHARPVDWVQGSAMFVRGSALKTVGLFDEQFWMYLEDTDWCRRFWLAGWSIYYVPHISLIHFHGRGSAAVPGIFMPLFKNKLAREHLKSWALYFWKWRGTRARTIFSREV